MNWAFVDDYIDKNKRKIQTTKLKTQKATEKNSKNELPLKIWISQRAEQKYPLIVKKVKNDPILKKLVTKKKSEKYKYITVFGNATLTFNSNKTASLGSWQVQNPYDQSIKQKLLRIVGDTRRNKKTKKRTLKQTSRQKFAKKKTVTWGDPIET